MTGLKVREYVEVCYNGRDIEKISAGNKRVSAVDECLREQRERRN